MLLDERTVMIHVKKGVREMGSKWFLFYFVFSPLTNSLLVEYEICD